MKHTWKNKFEMEVGAAMPVDAQRLPKQPKRRKYLQCPLCLESCSEGYWDTHHKKYLHLQCPFCLQWYAKVQGLSMHLSRSQCGFNLLSYYDSLQQEPKREVVVRIL